MKTISVQDLHNNLADEEHMKSAIIIDVRTPEEHAEGHIPGAQNRPIDKLDLYMEALKSYETVYVHCLTGGRSGKACEAFDAAGSINAYNIEGGVTAWKEAGYPVEM